VGAVPLVPPTTPDRSELLAFPRDSGRDGPRWLRNLLGQRVVTAGSLDRGRDWGNRADAWRYQEVTPGRPEAQLSGTLQTGGFLRPDPRGSAEVLCSLSGVVAGRRLDIPAYVRPNPSVRHLPGVPVVVRRLLPYFSNGALCGGYLHEEERACKPSRPTVC
jgi:hypothetical protein